MPVKKNQSVRAQLDAVTRERDLYKRTLQRVAREPFGGQDAIDALEAELGEGALDEITVEGMRDGQFTAEQLADRLPEVEAALTGKPVSGTALTLADIRAGKYSAEELAGRMDEVTALMEADR